MDMSHHSLKHLPHFLKPREKLMEYGVAALTTPELLALILASGTKSENVLQLSQRLTRSYSSLKDLAGTSFQDLTKLKGIGPIKAGQILATFELGKRVFQPSTQKSILTPEDVFQETHHLTDSHREKLYCLYLDARHQLLKKQLISIGSLNQIIIEPRDVFADALKIPCLGIILVHNHPSGNPEPSEEDITFTKKIQKAGKLLGIQLIDHVIIAKGQYVSLSQRRLI